MAKNKIPHTMQPIIGVAEFDKRAKDIVEYETSLQNKQRELIKHMGLTLARLGYKDGLAICESMLIR